MGCAVRCTEEADQPLKRAKLAVTRQPIRLLPDPSRVIARPFHVGSAHRIAAIVARVGALGDAEVAAAIAEVFANYGERHKDIRSVFLQNFALACGALDVGDARRLLLGAYFTNEYSIESAALFNPSMVAHPDQRGVAVGSTRFIMSLRACGEGHISSIEFRTGIVDANYRVSLDAPTRFATTTRPVDDALYDKATFALKLREMSEVELVTAPILARLGSVFTIAELKEAIAGASAEHRERGERGESGARDASSLFEDAAENVVWLAHSNYHVDFDDETELSERVIFPVSENESRGIEDARFVRFTNPDGSIVYYATYSAYNGFRVLPQLIETTNFRSFKINTLNGRAVRNKGMALFPRRIGDDFVMAARIDGENIFILRSDNVHFWHDATMIHRPRHRWEFVQLGNCGSPIETDAGWILLTHGVGPMREYSIGAILLDRDDPSRVIGELSDPLLAPSIDDRDGYVPNVLYSCGPMRHHDELVIPFAVSDSYTTFATVPIAELLDRLRG